MYRSYNRGVYGNMSLGKILIVDDDINICELLRLYAEKDEVYRHEAWAAAMRRMAEKLGVALIDLTRMSEELVASTDMEEVRTQWYMHLPANTYAHFPEGLSDDTHLQPMGAMRFGALIAQRLYELGGEYRALLCDEYEDWRKECK